MGKLDDSVNVEMEPEEALKLLLDDDETDTEPPEEADSTEPEPA